MTFVKLLNVYQKNETKELYKTVRTKKKLTLQTPQATVHSSLVADAWLAWHSIHKSMMWLRQIAQLSTTISVFQKKKSWGYVSTYNKKIL